MKKNIRPVESPLLQECDLIYSLGGLKALQTYMQLVDSRFSLGVDQEKTNQASVYRKEVLNYFKKMKK